MGSEMIRVPTISAMQILLDNKPDAVPQAYWRRLHWLQPCAFLYVIAWLGYGTFSVVMASGRAWIVVFLVLWGAFMFLLDLGPRWVNRRLKKEVVAIGFRMCIDCGYGLCALPRIHRCPECGREYNASQLEREWRNWFWREAKGTKD